MSDTQTIVASSPEARAVFWAVVMLGVLIVGLLVFAVIRVVHKRMADDDNAPAGLTLHELRGMRARGELTDEEFERARAIVLRQSGAAHTPPSRADGAAPDAGGKPDGGE